MPVPEAEVGGGCEVIGDVGRRRAGEGDISLWKTYEI